MAAPRQQLATILILSAIDVLLCSFTASLTLFFIGAGADAANSTPASITAQTADSDVRGAGAPACIVIARYDNGSARLRPAAASGFDTMPAEDTDTADSVAWLLQEAPTDGAPFTLLAQDNGNGLVTGLTISSGAETQEFNITCEKAAGVRIELTAQGIPRANRTCLVYPAS